MTFVPPTYYMYVHRYYFAFYRVLYKILIAELIFSNHLLIQYVLLRIILHYRFYSVLLVYVTGHTGSKGGVKKLVLQQNFCIESGKTHNMYV